MLYNSFTPDVHSGPVPKIWNLINPVKSKPWESLIGSVIPLLALLTSTGILCGCGLRFQSIVVASYFLVLSVGVDDVFIILRAWDRTNMGAPIPERLSKTLEDAGPSITIRCASELIICINTATESWC
ncbi:unnamed protein product [Gongylonema pulchrum]|uniref:SSD domain-containing protein n=1 Tax=Gongylonema pulchrum TaxID=637853 RepID=A0A183ERE2_9BILA|nr:unnamed protein product [Gongylonema pulchrum]